MIGFQCGLTLQDVADNLEANQVDSSIVETSVDQYYGDTIITLKIALFNRPASRAGTTMELSNNFDDAMELIK